MQCPPPRWDHSVDDCKYAQHRSPLGSCESNFCTFQASEDLLPRHMGHHSPEPSLHAIYVSRNQCLPYGIVCYGPHVQVQYNRPTFYLSFYHYRFHINIPSPRFNGIAGEKKLAHPFSFVGARTNLGDHDTKQSNLLHVSCFHISY